jgi:hypothetical protein
MSLQQLHGEPQILNSQQPETNASSVSLSVTNDLNEIEFEKKLNEFELSMKHQTIIPSFENIHNDNKNKAPHLNEPKLLFSNYVKHAKQFI